MHPQQTFIIDYVDLMKKSFNISSFNFHIYNSFDRPQNLTVCQNEYNLSLSALLHL